MYADEPVEWTKPDELAYSTNGPLPKLGGPFPGGFHGLSLISDDNFSATQTTRVLNLVARLP